MEHEREREKREERGEREREMMMMKMLPSFLFPKGLDGRKGVLQMI